MLFVYLVGLGLAKLWFGVIEVVSDAGEYACYVCYIFRVGVGYGMEVA